MYLPNADYCKEGDAVTCNGSNAIGIVTSVSLSRGLAWVMWPVGCGIDECVSVNVLIVIAPAREVINALQVIAPAPQLSNPLERAFLNGARPGASTEIVEDDAERVRPYRNPKALTRR